jgi:hypothetical protein
MRFAEQVRQFAAPACLMHGVAFAKAIVQRFRFSGPFPAKNGFPVVSVTSKRPAAHAHVIRSAKTMIRVTIHISLASMPVAVLSDRYPARKPEQQKKSFTPL